MNMQVTDIPAKTAMSVETARLVELHYDTLKTIARAKRRRAGAGQTMMTTDVLHESWLKLKSKGDWVDEAHFLRTAALAMRHVLVDYARAKLSQKRGEKAPSFIL